MAAISTTDWMANPCTLNLRACRRSRATACQPTKAAAATNDNAGSPAPRFATTTAAQRIPITSIEYRTVKITTTGRRRSPMRVNVARLAEERLRCEPAVAASSLRPERVFANLRALGAGSIGEQNR
ncbi:hypothetical protein MHEI_03330 [Mycobacterium heidelbergense]|nr:hypothetical protein MHEI_03330 [Mycobacterium heidelbergense]